MKGFHTNIEADTLENSNFRKVIHTGNHLQLVLMSLPPQTNIPMEIHPDNDQFFRFESGVGEAELDGEVVQFKADDVLIVHAGTQHEIRNTSSSEDLKLYTIYAPAHHPDGTIHKTLAEAIQAEEAENH